MYNFVNGQIHPVPEDGKFRYTMYIDQTKNKMIDNKKAQSAFLNDGSKIRNQRTHIQTAQNHSINL